MVLQNGMWPLYMTGRGHVGIAPLDPPVVKVFTSVHLSVTKQYNLIPVIHSPVSTYFDLLCICCTT